MSEPKIVQMRHNLYVLNGDTFSTHQICFFPARANELCEEFRAHYDIPLGYDGDDLYLKVNPKVSDAELKEMLLFLYNSETKLKPTGKQEGDVIYAFDLIKLPLSRSEVERRSSGEL